MEAHYVGFIGVHYVGFEPGTLRSVDQSLPIDLSRGTIAKEEEG